MAPDLLRCADCNKSFRPEEPGVVRCDRCYALQMQTVLQNVDLALIMAGWAPENSPVGPLVAAMPRLAPAVEGNTVGLSRDEFIDRLAAKVREASAPALPVLG